MGVYAAIHQAEAGELVCAGRQLHCFGRYGAIKVQGQHFFFYHRVVLVVGYTHHSRKIAAVVRLSRKINCCRNRKEPVSAGTPGVSLPGIGFSKRSSLEQAVTKNRAISKNAVSFANCAFIFLFLVVSVWF
jgi:hypothetical protein